MKKQQLNFSSKQNKAKTSIQKNRSLKKRKLITNLFKVTLCVFYFSLITSIALASINSGKIYQLRQRLINKPNDQDALLNLAMEYSLNNNFVKAVETYFTLLKISPKNFHAYNNLGILYKKSGQFRDSLHCYKQAEVANPDSYWVPYNMGLCYEAMGRMQEARESYGRALSLNAGFTQALQRLRNLSGGSNEPSSPLPALQTSGVYVVNGQNNQPQLYSQQQTSKVKTTKKVNITKKKEAPDKSRKLALIAKKIAARKSKETKYRTKRKSAGASLFNQAMESMDNNNLEMAIELYTRCVIAERIFLAEPDNGLIKKGLIYLKDRPNRMKDGLFYRGFFISISASPDLAIANIRSYLEQKKSSGSKGNSIFENEANNIVAKYEALIAEKERLAQKKEEENQALAMAKEAATANAVSETITKPGSYVVKQMNVDQVISEADRLSRANHQKDAISVLNIGLEKAPNNLKLLMKIANAYTDLMLLKGDREAGKMALLKFEKIYATAPDKSTESAVAKDMISELNGRIK